MGSVFHLPPLMTTPKSWKDPASAHLGCHSNMQVAWSQASPAEPDPRSWSPGILTCNTFSDNSLHRTGCCNGASDLVFAEGQS